MYFLYLYTHNHFIIMFEASENYISKHYFNLIWSVSPDETFR